MNYVLARRKFFTPWNWVYAKRIDIGVNGEMKIVATTDDIDEAIIFRNLEREDHFSLSTFSLRQI